MYWQYLIYVYAIGITFLLSMFLTAVMRRLAWKFDILDHPGERKVHAAPMPLMGGVAIVVSFFVVVLAHIAAFRAMRVLGSPGPERDILEFLGEGAQIKVAGILAGALMVFVLVWSMI